MKKKRFLVAGVVIGLILTVGGLLVGCSLMPGKAEAPTQEAQPAAAAAPSGAVIAEGRIVPAEFSDLYFVAPGKVDEVLVKEGQRVAKGDELVKLGDRAQYEAALSAARLEQIDAQQALDDLKEKAAVATGQANQAVLEAQRVLMDAKEKLQGLDTDEYDTKLDDAKTAVADADKELSDAKDEFDKYKDLSSDNSNYKNSKDGLDAAQDKYDDAVRERDRLINDLDQAKQDVASAQADYDQAVQEAEARKSGPDPKDLALAQGRVDNANAQAAAAQEALDQRTLLAPYDGTVTRVDIQAGEQAFPSKPVLQIADFSAWYVETTDLTENEVVNVAQDEKVTLAPDALPDQMLEGTVEKISQGYSERAGDITYQARIRITGDEPRLRWGMTVEVRFPESP